MYDHLRSLIQFFYRSQIFTNNKYVVGRLIKLEMILTENDILKNNEYKYFNDYFASKYGRRIVFLIKYLVLVVSSRPNLNF